MKASELTAGALTLALIMVCYFFFRGTANILNAVLVPLILYVCISRQGKKAVTATFIAFFALCALLFKLQFFFSLFYIAVSLLLYLAASKRLGPVVMVFLLAGASTLSFFFAIRLTDYIFLTQIETFMLSLAGGNFIIYLVVLALEGLLVGTGIVCGLYLIVDKRIVERHQPS